MEYRVLITDHVDFEVVVEADSPEEARAKATMAHEDGNTIEVDSAVYSVEVYEG